MNNPPLPSVRVFYGDNDIHEFYQDLSGDNCIAKTAGALFGRIKKQYQITLFFDQTQRWVRGKGKDMVLRPIESCR
jgi:hypothetical protein